MGFDQSLQGVNRAVRRARIAEQPEVVMRSEDDPEQLEGKLPGIGLEFEVPFVDGETDRLGNGAAQLALPGDEQVAHPSVPILTLDLAGDDKPAAPDITVA